MILTHLAAPSFCNNGLDPQNNRPFSQSFYAKLNKQISHIQQNQENKKQKTSQTSWIPSTSSLETVGRVAGAIASNHSNYVNNSRTNAYNNRQIGLNYNNQTTVVVNNNRHLVTEAERRQQRERQEAALRTGAVISGLLIAIPAIYQAAKRTFSIASINHQMSKLEKFKNSFNGDRQSFPGFPHLQTLDKAIDKRMEAFKKERSYAIAKISTLVAVVAAGTFLATTALITPPLMAIAAVVLIPTGLAAMATWTAASMDKSAKKCNDKAEKLFQSLVDYKAPLNHPWQPQASAPLIEEPEVPLSVDGRFKIINNKWYTCDGQLCWDDSSASWQPVSN